MKGTLLSVLISNHSDLKYLLLQYPLICQPLPTLAAALAPIGFFLVCDLMHAGIM